MASIESRIIDVFEVWGEMLVADAKRIIDASITADGGGQNSKLSGSVNYKVFNQNGKISFQLTMNDYWKFQDKGVDGTAISHGSEFKFKGKNINQKAMLAFVNARHMKIELSENKKTLNKSIRTKGIRQQHKKLSIEQGKKSLAFIIGASVAKKGIKPLHFMDKIITPDRITELKTMLAPIIKEQFILEIKDGINSNI